MNAWWNIRVYTHARKLLPSASSRCEIPYYAACTIFTPFCVTLFLAHSLNKIWGNNTKAKIIQWLDDGPGARLPFTALFHHTFYSTCSHFHFLCSTVSILCPLFAPAGVFVAPVHRNPTEEDCGCSNWWTRLMTRQMSVSSQVLCPISDTFHCIKSKCGMTIICRLPFFFCWIPHSRAALHSCPFWMRTHPGVHIHTQTYTVDKWPNGIIVTARATSQRHHFFLLLPAPPFSLWL